METFSAFLALCAGNSPVSGEFHTQTPVTRSFDVFFDMRLNKRLSKQTWGWWFETLSRPLWRHRNAELLHKRCPYNPNTITTARDTLPWASPTHTSSAWEVFLHTRGVVCSDWWSASKILRAIVVSVLPNSYCRNIIRNLFMTVNYPTL